MADPWNEEWKNNAQIREMFKQVYPEALGYRPSERDQYEEGDSDNPPFFYALSRDS
jgi:hypothetical protein